MVVQSRRRERIFETLTNLQHLLCFPGGVVVFRAYSKVVLVLFAGHVRMDGFARQTVSASAQLTPEFVHIVLIHTPTFTIDRLAMETVSHRSFGLSQSTLQEFPILFLC